MHCPSKSDPKRILCLVLMGLSHGSTALGDEAWLEKSRSILEESQQRPVPNWLREAMTSKAELSGIQSPTTKELGLVPEPSTNPHSPATAILVSSSMGSETLRDIFHANRGRKDRVIVFRGLPEGQSLKEFVGSFRSLLQGLKPTEIPPITLDPERFNRFGITRVPAIIREEKKGEATIVRGISQVEWLERQMAMAHGGKDLGVHGETVAVSEPDLMETLKKRARNFNWAKYQKEAQESFWQKAAFESLPEAIVDREHRIDPTITASRDIRDPQGRLIVVAGQRANPLDTLPFHQKLIVFNPMRPDEIVIVQEILKADPNQRMTLMASELDRSAGWQGLVALQKQLGHRVFLLTPDIRRRFKLKATPSVIEVDGRVFRIREIAAGKPQ